MNKYKNLTATSQVKAITGVLKGMYVNSTSTGTIEFNDGFTATEAGIKATGTFTVAAAIVDDDTVSIGGQTYTFKTALTASTTANEVLIGVSDATALDNIKSAINKSAGGGTTYGSETVANAFVAGTTNTDTTQVVEALAVGTSYNEVATLSSDAANLWGDPTLTGGLNVSPLINNTITPAIGYHDLGDVSFSNGLLATIANTLDVTIHYE